MEKSPSGDHYRMGTMTSKGMTTGMNDITEHLEFVYPQRWEGKWACLSYRDDNGKFRNRKFPNSMLMVQAIQELQGRDLWCTSALLVENDGNKRGATQPSRIIKLESDRDELDREFLKKAGARLIASGTEGHFHIYIRLTEPVDSDERERLARWVGRRLGITGAADSGGKFESNAVLRIPGTFNHKYDPPVPVRVVDGGEDIEKEALIALLGDVPEPVASIPRSASIEPQEPNEVPEEVADRLGELAGNDRSGQSYGFVQLCRENGLTVEETYALALQHEPTVDKHGGNEARIAEDVQRSWSRGARQVEDDIFSTPLLEFLHFEAKRRMIAPIAALGNALVHVGLAIPPDVLIPDVYGGVSNVNSAFAFIAPSGGGKGISSTPILRIPDTHQIEVRDPDVVLVQDFASALDNTSAGSGPALAAAFVQLQAIKDGKRIVGYDTVQHAFSAWFHWGEIDKLTALLSDKRDSTSAELREMWSGGPFGTFTKTGGRIQVGPHKARGMVTIAAQPDNCRELFKNQSGGFVQRLVFLNAFDENKVNYGDVERETREIALPKKWPEFFAVDSWIANKVRDDYAENKSVGADNSHRNLSRLKVAALLAVMHGSTDIGMQWWDIAGAIMAHSDQTMAEIRARLKEVAANEKKQAGVAQAIQNLAERGAMATVEARAQKRILEELKEHGGRRTRARVKNRMSKQQQGIFEQAVTALVADGLIVHDGRYLEIRAKG